MTSEFPLTLIYVADPTRVPAALPGVEVLTSTLRTDVLRDRLAAAAELIVDDVLCFPFEAIGLRDTGVPTMVRLPEALSATGVRQVVGTDVIEQLGPFDLLAGPPELCHELLADRGLPRNLWVGEGDAGIAWMVERAREWRETLDHQWQPRARPPGWRLDVVDASAGIPPGPRRLATIRSRVDAELKAVQRVLQRAAAEQPATRDLHVAVAAARPHLHKAVLPTGTASFTTIRLVPEDESSPDRVTASVIPGPDLRLSLDAQDVDVVVVAADLLGSAPFALRRLFGELVRLVRPGGTLALLADVVTPGDAMPGRDRLGASATTDLMSRAGGGRLLLTDVEAIRRPDQDRHHLGLFTWRHLGNGGESAWTSS